MLVLSVLLLAVATPAPAPRPTATNPFTLAPIPGTPLPVIGTTRSKPVCTAIRQAVAPALRAAMANDQVFGVLRPSVYRYVSTDTDTQKDMHLMQMDRQVDDMVKSIDALETALKSPSWDTAKANPDDAKTMHQMHDSLASVLEAQKVQRDVMSGFVATEQQRRFGQLDESQKQMMAATGNVQTTRSTTNGIPQPGSTPHPLDGFLHDALDWFDLKNPTPKGLHDAVNIDRDMNGIQRLTTSREQQATKAIVTAAQGCK